MREVSFQRALLPSTKATAGARAAVQTPLQLNLFPTHGRLHPDANRAATLTRTEAGQWELQKRPGIGHLGTGFQGPHALKRTPRAKAPGDLTPGPGPMALSGSVRWPMAAKAGLFSKLLNLSGLLPPYL